MLERIVNRSLRSSKFSGLNRQAAMEATLVEVRGRKEVINMERRPMRRSADL
jgi:hypothetical protein